VKFAFMQKQRDRFPLPLMCRVLKVSRSGFYAALEERVSARVEADHALLTHIQSIHRESRRTYGSPRVLEELRSRGIRVGRKRIARLMRRNGLRGCAARRRRVRTHAIERNPQLRDHVQRQFRCAKLDQVWVADLTYIRTDQGWVYLAVVLDLCSRRVVGWHTATNPDYRVTLHALNMAAAHRRARSRPVHHSDRGVQYSCTAYQQRLTQLGITPSFGRVGQCWDNAVAESFFHTLKTECVPDNGYRSVSEARRALFDYIEVWYNRKRRHSTLGYISPAEYESRL
jgi:putative transposase